MRTYYLSLTLVIGLLWSFASAQSRLSNTDNIAVYTDIPAGPVSGIWTRAGSPYHISGEIIIPNDSTLLIEPGVEVVFLGHYKFNVQGRLLAVGTEQDTIRFRAADAQTGWHGIRFEDTPSTNDTSKVFYCSLKYGNANTGGGFDRSGGAMLIKWFDKVLVSHCLFDSNSQSGEASGPSDADGGIFIYHASPTVTHSTFTNNTSSKSSAIGCVEYSRAVIADNIFRNNSGKYGAIAVCFNSSGTVSGNLVCNNVATEAAGGILVDNGATPVITNNVIIHNQGFSGGVTCYKGGRPILIGNTIAYNTASFAGGGIGCREDADPILINNILYGNAAPIGQEVAFDDDESDPIFLCCNIQGGREGFGIIGAGTNYTGRFEHNIAADPLFVNAASNDYRLSDASPCIGAGLDSVEVAGVWYYVPSYCVGGNPRPSPAGTLPDIGAYENLLGSPVVGVRQWLTNPTSFAVRQNYPNPFNPSTTIKYDLPQRAHVVLTVFNMLGQTVTTLLDEVVDAGYHEAQFDASALASGVYLYRLTAGDFIQTRKLILVR